MTSRRFQLACLTFAAVVAGACTESTPPVPIATIQLQPGLDSIEVGATYGFWIVTLKNAIGETINDKRQLRWESQQPNIATIDSLTGVVTAHVAGDAIIILRGEGKQAQATMRVIKPVISIVMTPDSFDLPMTTTRTIFVTLVGPNGEAIQNRQTIFSSLNPAVAVVNATGLVTAVSPGTTTIRVVAGGKSGTSRVRVVAEPVNSVRILPQQSNHILRVTHTKQLSAECLSATQQVLTGRTITWNSSNPLAATVSANGFVTAMAVGTSTIVVTCENVSGSSPSANTTITVTLVPVSNVTIAPSTGLSLSMNQPGPLPQGQLLATARDSAGNVLSLQGRTVTWTSNNQPVAQVSSSGVVTGVSIGFAEVNVSVTDPGGSTVTSAPVPVTVNAFFSVLPSPRIDAAQRWRSSVLVASR